MISPILSSLINGKKVKCVPHTESTVSICALNINRFKKRPDLRSWSIEIKLDDQLSIWLEDVRDDILCSFPWKHFILGFYLNMFTCFPAKKTVFLILYCIPPLSETLCCCIYKTTERKENKQSKTKSTVSLLQARYYNLKR